MDCSAKYAPIKVAFIIDKLAGSTGGTEKHLISLIDGLDGTHIKPYLVVLRNSKYLKNTPIHCPLHIVDLPKLLHPRVINKGIGLYAFLRRNGILIAHIFFNDSSVFAPFFCKLADSKVILARRDLGFNYTPEKLFLLRLNRIFIDCVISNSRAVKSIVCREEGWCSHRKVKVIYNGLDLKKFKKPYASNIRRQFNIPQEANIVGMIANLNPWKRHEDLIEAFRYVFDKKPKSHLVIGGDGMMKHFLQEKAETLGIKHVVHFLGSVKNVIPIIKEFSVGVLCSETEGFSNALLEYMACGKAVVATGVGGNSEIIEDGVNGFLIPVGNVKKLSEKILTLLEDFALASNFGNFAIQNVKERFTAEKMLDSHIAIYEKLVKSYKREPTVRKDGNIVF